MAVEFLSEVHKARYEEKDGLLCALNDIRSFYMDGEDILDGYGSEKEKLGHLREILRRIGAISDFVLPG